MEQDANASQVGDNVWSYGVSGSVHLCATYLQVSVSRLMCLTNSMVYACVADTLVHVAHIYM